MSLSRVKQGIEELFANLPHAEKALHALVLIWVLTQIISSNFMHVHADTIWSSINQVAKLHVYGGLLLVPISLLFMYKALKRRTLADMYPWLSGDFSQIKADIQAMRKFELPKTHPAGLAATVEGLGLLALLLALVTGTLWYIVASSSGVAPTLLSIHKTSVGIIEAYFYAHATMAVLHYIKWWRTHA